MIVMGLGFGMVFAPAINTATAGVRREDSGVASALVNTMQQVGGSIGTSALSTIALTTTATYVATHRAGPLTSAIGATRGYTMAFAVAAGLLAAGAIFVFALVPSKHRVDEHRSAAGVPPRTPKRAPDVIPVALVCCSPVSHPVPATDRAPEHATSAAR